MKHPAFFGVLFLSLFICSCSTIPPEAYGNRGQPESLLDVSSEVVNLDISSQQAVDDLARWVDQDQPSRAELYCVEASAQCRGAMDVADLYGLPYILIPSQEFTATLIYERVLARDCENRYIDNSINPYHLNHPSFGCSLAVNMVQQVADKQQMVRPNLLGAYDAKKALQTYRRYEQPPKNTNQQRGVQNSLVNSARAQ